MANATQRREPILPRYSQGGDRDVIGTSVPRVDALAKVTGAAEYTHDVILPDMLFAVVVRSPHAAALVVSVDEDAALALPGVEATLSYPGAQIRYAGQEVAAVAAQSLGQARDAAAAMSVVYEVYEAVVTVEDALAPGAPQVYEDRPNVGTPRVVEEGDVEAGFAQSDVTYEAEFRTQVQTHSPMETHSVVARWDDDTHMTVWISTQGIFSSRNELASYFGLPQENVRVICQYIGGGFGSKIGAGAYGRMAAELARLAGRPVKLILDRKAEQLATGNRPDSLQQLKIGARSDGTFTAISLSGYATPGVGSGSSFALAARGLYTFPAYRTQETAVYTNCGPAATMRAPGHPQGVFSVEAAIDELAYQLGMDPVELRVKNDPHPMRRAQFQIGADTFGWSSRNPVAGADSGPVKRGVGVASCTWTGGGSRGYQVRVTIWPDGRVLAETGIQDIGTGCRTWVPMLVAEELGLPAGRVEIEIGDTNLPLGCFAGGSTTIPSMSPPAREAGELAREALAAVVAPVFGAVPEQLSFEGGQIVATNGASISFEQGCSYLGQPLVVVGERGDRAKLKEQISTGVHFVEVEVDTRTGKISVLRVVAVHDAGRILNRLTAESQIYGGVVQSINYALFEERVMDRASGLMLNANLEGYKIGGSRDMPDIQPILLDLASGGTYVGALGLGEPPVIPTTAAIGNAVRHALGVRLTSIPFTPAKVLEALGTIPARTTRRMGGRR